MGDYVFRERPVRPTPNRQCLCQVQLQQGRGMGMGNLRTDGLQVGEDVTTQKKVDGVDRRRRNPTPPLARLGSTILG